MRRATAVLATLLLLLVACGSESQSFAPRPTPTPTLSAAPTPAEARTVTDMMGRTVRVPADVSTVVVLSPTAAELALALDLDVIGRSTDGADIRGLEGTPAVGSPLFPDFNAAAALEPDLLIADAAYQGGRDADFARFPYPVFVVHVQSLDGVSAALLALGEAVGREDVAGAAVEALEADIDAIVASVAGQPPVRVLILSGAGRDVYVASTNTYIGSMVEALGGENVVGDEPDGAPLPGFGLIDVGAAAAHDPDIVLLLSTEAGALEDEILSEPSWAEARAVVDGRLVELRVRNYLRVPGPGAPSALAALADLLYP